MNNFELAFYWFLMHPFVVTMTTGVATVMAIVVSMVLVLRKWGGYE